MPYHHLRWAIFQIAAGIYSLFVSEELTCARLPGPTLSEAVLELAKEAATGIARARRFSLQLPVRYRTMGADTWHQGKTENVSCTGMLIRAGERIDVNQPVEVVLVLEVDVVGEVSPEVLCLGQVVRKYDPVPTSPFARVAVRIQDYHFPGEVPFAKA